MNKKSTIYTDEFGASVSRQDNKVISLGKETSKFLKDVNTEPKFFKLKSLIIFDLAHLFNLDITYQSPYKFNCKGKYYTRKNGKLFKNI